jgi:uncharacterized protein (TIGR02246 family)
MSEAKAQVNTTDDPTAVARAFYEKVIRLWNEEGKTDSSPSMYTEDADLINAAGPHWHGRDEIVARTLAVVSSFRPTLSYKLISAKAIAPGIILAIAVGVATIPNGQPRSGQNELSQSVLLVKQGSEWKARFFQSTPVVNR